METRQVMIPTLPVLGTSLACTDYENALEYIRALAQSERPAMVCAANTHIVSLARHDPTFAAVMRRFDLILPDGMPLIWSLNQRGAGLRDRVYGPYFMQEALRRHGPPWRHFFFGGRPETLDLLVRTARELNPNIVIAGTYSPPFRAWTESDEENFAQTIRQAHPDFIWVALGGERQERWIEANLHRHSRGVFLAVGDAFELLAGRRPFAPLWMQRLGLTWFYRLMQEPRRLWPRYFRFNTLFIYYSLRESFCRRHVHRPHPLSGVHQVGPVKFQDISKNDLIETVLAPTSRPRLFTALNAYSLSLALNNPRLMEVLNRSFVCFCDGFGVHVMYRLFEGGRLRHRVTPTDWLEEMITLAHQRGIRVYMLGDQQQVVQKFFTWIESRLPGVIAGFHNGFFAEHSPEEDAIVQQINQSGAQIVVLCMGMPRQEFWGERMRDRLRCSSIIMAGASMAFLTGFRRRGPRWATDHGLEWLFRVIYEPVRMSPRYLIGLPRLFLQMMRWKLLHPQARKTKVAPNCHNSPVSSPPAPR